MITLIMGVVVYVLLAGFFGSRLGKFIRDCDEDQRQAFLKYLRERKRDDGK
jgi:hypothetical protein